MDDFSKFPFFVLLFSSVAVYLVSLAFFRLFLHPLAKFPGPKFAALSRNYEAYFDVIKNGQFTFKIADLHKQYGPIVRISPYEIHINDPNFYEKLYRQDGVWNKYDWSYDAFGAPSSTICTIEHHAHRWRRAPLNAYFSKISVANKQSMIHSRVEKLRTRIEHLAAGEAVFNLSAAVTAYTIDISTEFVMARSYNCLDHSDFNEPLMNMLQASGAMWRASKHLRFLGPMMKAMPLRILEKSGDPAIRAFVGFLKTSKSQTQQIMHEITTKQNSQTSKDLSPRTLIHEILCASSIPQTEKEYARVCDEVETITGAGLETVAQVLRFTVYYLYTNPPMLRRLRTELQNSETEVLAKLEHLPYLTAVITEGLRLSPGLATRLARIAPDRDLVYNDKWVIPAGTPVSMTTLLMHWDEAIYSDAKQFAPERWLENDIMKNSEKAFGPFSRGTRNCLGMHLAWAELYMALAMLVSRFDFDFVGTGPEDVDPHSDQFVVGTKSKRGVIVRARLYNT
ncbi:MAG: hypothetical protein Q9227_003481 [Pyrenula ochraceoflavens]